MGGGQSTEVPGGGSEGYHVLKVLWWHHPSALLFMTPTNLLYAGAGKFPGPSCWTRSVLWFHCFHWWNSTGECVYYVNNRRIICMHRVALAGLSPTTIQHICIYLACYVTTLMPRKKALCPINVRLSHLESGEWHAETNTPEVCWPASQSSSIQFQVKECQRLVKRIIFTPTPHLTSIMHNI